MYLLAILHSIVESLLICLSICLVDNIPTSSSQIYINWWNRFTVRASIYVPSLLYSQQVVLPLSAGPDTEWTLSRLHFSLPANNTNWSGITMWLKLLMHLCTSIATGCLCFLRQPHPDNQISLATMLSLTAFPARYCLEPIQGSLAGYSYILL